MTLTAAPTRIPVFLISAPPGVAANAQQVQPDLRPGAVYKRVDAVLQEFCGRIFEIEKVVGPKVRTPERFNDTRRFLGEVGRIGFASAFCALFAFPWIPDQFDHAFVGAWVTGIYASMGSLHMSLRSVPGEKRLMKKLRAQHAAPEVVAEIRQRLLKIDERERCALRGLLSFTLSSEVFAKEDRNELLALLEGPSEGHEDAPIYARAVFVSEVAKWLRDSGWRYPIGGTEHLAELWSAASADERQAMKDVITPALMGPREDFITSKLAGWTNTYRQEVSRIINQPIEGEIHDVS